ncbi:MAG TPA: hypothetical protein VF487_02770 [Chitinophagaceae bacterium]
MKSKRKYITSQICLACQSKPVGKKKDIHIELEETIKERKGILEQWERLYPSSYSYFVETNKDIHTELEQTIAQHKRTKQQWSNFFSQKQDRIVIVPGKKAA